MYSQTALLYDALYSFKDYRTATTYIVDLVRTVVPAARTLLDVACGTGRHVEFLQEEFEVEGIDIDARMLAVARTRCPGVRFHDADMVTFDLHAHFDVVTCLFSSIAYVRTLTAMRRAIAAMKRHLVPGGLLLIEPWFTPELFWDGHVALNVVERDDCKIAWMYAQKRRRQVSVLDVHYLVGDPRGVQHLVERHELGLFTREQYEDAFTRQSLAVSYDEEGPFGRGLYVGRL